jgi:hypothetical protein
MVKAPQRKIMCGIFIPPSNTSMSANSSGRNKDVVPEYLQNLCARPLRILQVCLLETSYS